MLTSPVKHKTAYMTSLLHQMSSFSCLRVYLPNHSQFWRLLSAFRTLELERAPKAWFANSVQSTGFTHQVEVSPETQHWTPQVLTSPTFHLELFHPPINTWVTQKPFLTISITTLTPQTMLDPYDKPHLSTKPIWFNNNSIGLGGRAPNLSFSSQSKFTFSKCDTKLLCTDTFDCSHSSQTQPIL